MAVSFMDGMNAYPDFSVTGTSGVPVELEIPKGMRDAAYTLFGATGFKEAGFTRGKFYPRIYINGTHLSPPSSGNSISYMSYGNVIKRDVVKNIFCFSFSVLQSEFEYRNYTSNGGIFHGAGIMPLSRRGAQLGGFFFSRYSTGALMFGVALNNSASYNSGDIMPDPRYWNADEPNRVELVINFNENKFEGWINDTLLYEASVDSTIFKEDLLCGLKFYASATSSGPTGIGNLVTSDARIGPCNIRLSRPSADLETDFVSQGDTNFSQVRDVPADGDTTYVEANDEGAADLYKFSPKIELSAGRKILAVKHVVVARRSSPDPRYLFTRIGDVRVNVPMVAAFNDYAAAGHTMEINPATGVEWTAADLNNSPFGYELQDTF